MEIINESIDLYKFQGILKLSTEVNITNVLNSIRAIPYVITVRSKEDPRLEFRGSSKFIYLLVNIKFINVKPNPKLGVAQIKDMMINGHTEIGKIEGIYQFIPVLKTLKAANS